MDIANLSADKLRQVIKIVEQRDLLAAQLKTIDQRLTAILGGSEEVAGAPALSPALAPRRRGRPPGTTKKALGRPKGRRGELKSRILKELEAAGSAGVSVKELSTKLKVKPQNIHVWFSSTGKSVPGVSRVGEGRYALKA